MAASLNYKHVFGVKVNVPNGLHYADDASLVYPAGHNVIKFTSETKLQEMINASEASLAISCLAISPSRRYVAVAEKRADGAVASIFNLRNLFKKKSISTPELASREFVSMSFSADDAILMTLGGAPDWMLCCWAWDKGKLLSMLKVSASPDTLVYQCLLNPINATKCCVNGNRTLKLLTVEDDRMLSIPMPSSFLDREPTDYKSLTWLPEDRFVVGTRSGDILLFRKEELLSVISSSTATAVPRAGPGAAGSPALGAYDASINVIVPCAQGFFTGNDQGIVRLYEPVTGSGGTLYADVKAYRLPITDVTPGVVHMALSPSEELLAVITSTCGLLQLSLTQADVKEDVSFESVGVWSHNPVLGVHINALSPPRSAACGITGLDTCVRKPVLITCGVDCTVRLWNYTTKTQDFCKSFAEEPHAVALHPSGFFAAVGFSDKLRVMNVLMDDLRPFKELAIKAAKEIRFSNGGSMFAVASGNLVFVYAFNSCEPIAALRGHNGKVTSVAWQHNDTVLASVGLDGAVYQWSIPDGKRFGEFLHKGIGFTSVVSSRDGATLYVTASDNTTKQIDMVNSIATLEADVKTHVGALVATSNGYIMFAGRSVADAPGAVLSYVHPFNGDVLEFPACAGPVSRMRLSNDDSTLFVAGADGALMIMEVRDKDGRVPHRDSAVAMPWSDEVLITRTDLEERSAAIAELRDAVEELQSNNDYANRMRDIAFQERLKKLTERYTTELDHNREQYDLLREEKMDVEHEYSERLKVMETSHQAELQKRESLYQNKIMEEVDRFQELQLEVEAEKDRQKEIQQKIVNAHAAEVQATKSKCSADWAEVSQRHTDMADEVAGVRHDWEEMRRQMEEDIDTEVESLKKRCEDELSLEREATLKYKGDNGIMKKKFAALLKEIDDQKEDIKTMLIKEKDLAVHIETLKKEIEMLRGVINDKDDTIADKEKKIYELKKRNQELEKFKFVLDYKIRELKRQIEPREVEIQDMRAQIKKVDGELESYHKSNAELDGMIGTLRKQLDELQASMADKRAQLTSHDLTLSRFKHDLHAVIQELLHADKLAAGMLALKEEFGLDDTASSQKPNEAITREYSRQRDFLRKQVDDAKRQLQADATDAASLIRRVTEENLSLIAEIKSLRQELKTAKAQRAMVKARVKPARSTPAAASTAVVVAGSTTPHTGRSTPAHVDALIALQREEIGNLKAEVRRLEGLLASVRQP